VRLARFAYRRSGDYRFGGGDAEEMTTYVVVSSMNRTLLTVNVIPNLNDRINNGPNRDGLIEAGEFSSLFFLPICSVKICSVFSSRCSHIAVGIIFVRMDFPSITNFLFFPVNDD